MMNVIKKMGCLLLFASLPMQALWAKADTKPLLGTKVTDLVEWQFSKQVGMWSSVTVPHSCNAIDGRSARYYRGKAYYRKVLDLSESQATKPLFLLFEGAAQAAVVQVNGQVVAEHRGGYTPFVVDLKSHVKAGENEILVICDNKENVELIPVSSDFNKNNGLHNPVHLLEMNEVYAVPDQYGLYRMHVSTPSVSQKQAVTRVEAAIRNASSASRRMNVILKLTDDSGKVCYQKKQSVVIAPEETFKYQQQFSLKNPHLWNGLKDPYLYQAQIEITDKDNRRVDLIQTTVGYRFYRLDKDKGFFLNGQSYPLRGVCMHQDWDLSASALSYAQIDKDYEFVKELGTNFLRLAHYPHNDYAFRKCDELGVIVQTEIPWVNVCGVKASESYFEDIESQMREMIVNLYNHPSIVFWGMWNELDSWGNNDSLQGTLDADRVVSESAKLYDLAKSIDPDRCVGMSDCSNFERKGYENLKADYYSENRYNGWYYRTTDHFTPEMQKIHEAMGVLNVSEYGAGVNPFCHSLDPMKTTQKGTGGSRHDEEYGNLVHESHLAQIVKMPFLNFTSIWLLFDFPVADRYEGYMDTDDGIHFIENEQRKFINDKGLVTRDRQTRKDVFYLYKSYWNREVPTVYITSRRFSKRPAETPVAIKVYSNAASLTLYYNGQQVETLNAASDETGVVWKFKAVKLDAKNNRFKVVAADGTTDEIEIERI